ncbi:hypothetical protein ABZ725_49790 [Streptomyces sp. NPDC006872]|uniref:hypothetical protein n=1 Tax=Streptomyces sp. NPDC006872 TaxID=3155720 RepID=UPI00340E4759
MVRVPWEKLAESPRLSESLVTLLVMRLRERAQPVDGTGGDGGRDLFEYTDDGELVVYDAKSFTGRTKAGCRRQVEQSLASAARHQPDTGSSGSSGSSGSADARASPKVARRPASRSAHDKNTC